MYDVERRKTVLELYQQGVPKKQIARLLNLDPKTVRSIILAGGNSTPKPRHDRIELELGLVESVYRRCDGWAQRVHEILTEEYGIKMAYSTLTQRLRELGLSDRSGKDLRCEDGADYIRPGQEMQQDTSPYVLKFSGRPVRVVGSGLYLRYSKRRFVQFYLRYCRFEMKCFMNAGLKRWEKVPLRCIIDNTNLAVLRGTGANAVMVPEMAAFAKALGFEWQAHALMHSNRKGGKERNFWTVETNFFPGREFKDLEDLNRQALEWCDRFDNRPQSGTRLIPLELFEQEKADLQDLPAYVEPPYRTFDRWTDRYGYVSLHGNFYWVPGTRREILQVIEYPDTIKLFRGQELLIEHPKAGQDKRGEKIKPPGAKPPSECPQNHKQDSREEERRLRAKDQVIARYLDWLKTAEGAVRCRHKFIRELDALSRQLSSNLFMSAIARAHEYGITDLHAIERIASQILHSGEHDPMSAPWEQQALPLDYEQRDSYRSGCFASEPDMDSYGKLLEGKTDEQADDVKHNPQKR